MKSFITWRLNFYRFKWWRRLAGIPEPRPMTALQRRMLDESLNILGSMLAANVDKDYEHAWKPCEPAQLIKGDTLTFAGVTKADRRNRWQRLKDFVLRRPAPKPELQRFQITGMVGASINVKRPTPFKAAHKDKYL